MSTFTTELRYMLESYAGYTENQPASKVNDVIDESRSSLFDFDYPHSNLTTSEKEHLEKHIMLHYYFKEIGFETFGLFKTKLQSKLWDIMPKYDKLYATEHLDLDFFNDVDYTRKLDSQIDRDGTDTKTGSIRDLNDGYDETVTSGKIISQNSGSITDTKTGTETIENGGFTESDQTGSVNDSGTTTVEHTQVGSTYDEQSGQLNKVTNGAYADTESGMTRKKIKGGYTDANTGDVRNLSSDTPQGEIDLSTNDYVSAIEKRIDNTETERTYDDYVEQEEFGPFEEQGIPDPIPGRTMTRTYDNLMESTRPVDYKTEHGVSNDFKATDKTTVDMSKEYDHLKNKVTDNTNSETTYDTENVSTDTTKNEQTFDDYKVRNTDTKGRTQTYNNLMNTIDNTDITDLTERIYGNVSGNNIKKLVDYRDSIINIELMIIKDLKPLFMGLFM